MRHKQRDQEAGGEGLGIVETRKRLWEDANGKVVKNRPFPPGSKAPYPKRARTDVLESNAVQLPFMHTMSELSEHSELGDKLSDAESEDQFACGSNAEAYNQASYGPSTSWALMSPPQSVGAIDFDQCSDIDEVFWALEQPSVSSRFDQAVPVDTSTSRMVAYDNLETINFNWDLTNGAQSPGLRHSPELKNKVPTALQAWPAGYSLGDGSVLQHELTTHDGRDNHVTADFNSDHSHLGQPLFSFSRNLRPQELSIILEPGTYDLNGDIMTQERPSPIVVRVPPNHTCHVHMRG